MLDFIIGVLIVAVAAEGIALVVLRDRLRALDKWVMKEGLAWRRVGVDVIELQGKAWKEAQLAKQPASQNAPAEANK